MSKINDGGPAFPVADLSKTQIPGMSLRDWLAGMALQGVVSEMSLPFSLDPDEIFRAARDCYRIADAMIAQREKQSQ